MAFDPTAYVALEKGHAFEDFAIGQRFEHHWGRTLTEGDNALFTTLTLAYNPLYFNADYAREEGHPGIVLNPMLVLCTVVGLSVEDLSEAGGPFLGVDELRFLRPVYPGDTLTSASAVLATRESRSRPGFGVVSWRSEGRNQRGEIVVEFTRTNLVAKRARR
jgi:itaconyl-CoA hydratase